MPLVAYTARRLLGLIPVVFGVVVITFTRTLMVYRRGHGPSGNRPRPASPSAGPAR